MSSTNWQNLPSTSTPLNATNLNKIENKLKELEENPVIYSTLERRVGVWTNNQPLYRKTIDFPNGNSGTTTVVEYNLSDLGVYNVSHIHIGVPSYYTIDGGNKEYPFNFYDGNRFEIAVTNSKLIVTLGYAGIASSPFTVTLEYTKTTD